MTIIIDPNLSKLDLLKLKDYFNKNNEKMITCFSLLQYEYLKDNISNHIECKGINLSISERDEYNKIFSYLDKLQELDEANIKLFPDKFPYYLHVAKFYHHYFNSLGRLFWLVFKIISDNLYEVKNNNLIAIGNNPIFFSAVTSAALYKRITVQKVHFKKKDEDRALLLYKKNYIRAINDELSLHLYKKNKNKKKVFIKKGTQTLPWISYIKKQRNIALFLNSYSKIDKIINFHNIQNEMVEAVDKIEKKLIEIFFKYPMKNNIFNPKILKNFLISLKSCDESVKKSITDGFFIWRNLDKIKPDIVVCSNWTGMLDQFFKSWCKVNKKPFVVLQHGIHSGGIISDTERIIDADIFLCWGDEMKKSFINIYRNNKNVIKVVGNPLYDDKLISKSYKNVKKKNFKKDLKYYHKILISPSAKSFLGQDYEDIFWNEIEYTVIRHPEIRWCIRFHNKYIYKDFIKNKFEKLGATFLNEGSIFEAIKDCHLVITNISTVALDAMIMQKPVIIFNLEKLREKFSNFNAGIIIKEKGIFYGKFLELLNKNFNDLKLMENQNLFASAFNSPNAINKIINLIKEA